jgi:hypothetical protein
MCRFCCDVIAVVFISETDLDDGGFHPVDLFNPLARE